MKKYISQLVFFTSLIELLIILFFNFFNFTQVILIKNLFDYHLLNLILNLSIILILNYFLAYIYLNLIKKDGNLIYISLGIFLGFLYFGIYKLMNYHEIIQLIDILCIIFVNIFKTYMICYSLFYKYLL